MSAIKIIAGCVLAPLFLAVGAYGAYYFGLGSIQEASFSVITDGSEEARKTASTIYYWLAIASPLVGLAAAVLAVWALARDWGAKPPQ